MNDEKIAGKIIAGPIALNHESLTLSYDEKVFVLPRKEFDLLLYFINNPSIVQTREMILQNVWGPGVYVGHRTIDVHVRKIRDKLGKYSELIETIKGTGYRFRLIE